MRRLVLLLLPLTIAACSETLEPPNEESAATYDGGKTDSFSQADNRLTMSGDIEKELELDRATHCQLSQWGIMATWPNVEGWNDPDFPALRFSLNDMESRAPGQTWDMSSNVGRLIFDGSGFTSEGGACVAELSGYYNDGEQAGMKLTLDDCILIDSEYRAIVVDGDLSCVGQGYAEIEIPGTDDTDDATEDPVDPDVTPDDGSDPTDTPDDVSNPDAPDTVCGDAAYLSWMDELRTALGSVGTVVDAAERAELDALVAARPCDSSSNAAYSVWVNWLHTTILSSGTILDDTEQLVAGYVMSARPATATGTAYIAWLGILVAEMERHGSYLDDDEQSFLTLLQSARPPAFDAPAYVPWFGAYFSELAAANSIVDEREAERLAVYLEAQPHAEDEASYWDWLQVYQEELGGAGSIVAAEELGRLDQLMMAKPCLADAEMAESEDDYMSFQQAFDDGSHESVIEAVLQAAPSLCE